MKPVERQPSPDDSPKPLSPHLRMLEDPFLKPAAKADGAFDERDIYAQRILKRPPRHDDHE